jgi:hypothetical protein
MNRRITIWLLATVLLTTSTAADAQQPKKVPLIGYLSGAMQLVTLPVPRPFGWLCASVAT